MEFAQTGGCDPPLRLVEARYAQALWERFGLSLADLEGGGMFGRAMRYLDLLTVEESVRANKR